MISNANGASPLSYLLPLKPIRAVDRLLTEQSLETAFAVHAQLQEKIKKNTTQLREKLSEKYQNLVECAGVIHKVQEWVNQIVEIQKSISSCMNLKEKEQPPVQSQSSLSFSQSLSLIHQNLSHRKYRQSLSLSLSSPHPYCKFLIIQIMQELQQEIRKNKLQPIFLREVIKCIRMFGDRDRGRFAYNISQLPDGLSKQIQAKWETSRRRDMDMDMVSSMDSIVGDEDILEIIFKCKLSSLKEQQPTQVQQHSANERQHNRIVVFFSDLHDLLQSSPGNLSPIFITSLSSLSDHLSSIFLQSVSPSVLSFNYDLYLSLLNDERFINVLQKVDKVVGITQSGGKDEGYSTNSNTSSNTGISTAFRSLWQQYYQKLIDLMVSRCNLRQLIPVPTPTLPIPKEIGKYRIDRTYVQVRNTVGKYKELVNIMLSNIQQTLKQSAVVSTHDESKIISYFNLKWEAMIEGVKLHMESIDVNNAAKLHQMLFLFFCFKVYDNALTASSLQLCRSQFPIDALQRCHKFVQQPRAIQQWAIQLEMQLVGYIGMEGIKEATLAILSGKIKSMGGQPIQLKPTTYPIESLPLATIPSDASFKKHKN